VKFEIACTIIEKAAAFKIAENRLFIDPLVVAISTQQDSLLTFNDTVRKIKEKFPGVHITSGLSNISFGMPFRQNINRQFLSLAMSAGMDSAILDPLSIEMRSTLYATKALLCQDEFLMEYIGAFREGVIGTPKK
jgi:5-methyltetrahydrofolate--homocysteine methyltransferase